MGLLDRIRGYRKEASQRLVDYTGDLTVPPTYMSPLVTGEVWNCDSKLHQLEVATKDAVANYICVKVAENVFDDWFIFVDEEGEVNAPFRYDFDGYLLGLSDNIDDDDDDEDDED